MRDTSHSIPHQTRQDLLLDYISFHIPDESFSDMANCIGIVRGIMHDCSTVKRDCTSAVDVLLCIPVGYYCVDICLYKESRIVLLLNETNTTSKSSGDAWMMIVPENELPFASITRSTCLNYWNLHQLKDCCSPENGE